MNDMSLSVGLSGLSVVLKLSTSRPCLLLVAEKRTG